jgi:hypothetical protein
LNSIKRLKRGYVNFRISTLTGAGTLTGWSGAATCQGLKNLTALINKESSINNADRLVFEEALTVEKKNLKFPFRQEAGGRVVTLIKQDLRAASRL